MHRLARQFLTSLPFRIVRKASITYDRDGLITVHNADFVRNPRFAAAYAAGRATGSWGDADLEWRVHIALWAAGLAAARPGDFVECGVNRGGMARAIVDGLDWNASGKRFLLLDTFAGFDPRAPAAFANQWGYDQCHEAVLQTFAAFPTVETIKGPVPDTLPCATVEHVAFLHIDMNAVEPERAAMAWFWPRIVPGGVMLLDDYGWAGHEAQKAAHDAFAAANGFAILGLPTGQGLAIKGWPSS